MITKLWLRLLCRFFGHKPKILGPAQIDAVGIGVPVTVGDCVRCGAKNLYSWIYISGSDK